jgi:hypothetical protein
MDFDPPRVPDLRELDPPPPLLVNISKLPRRRIARGTAIKLDRLSRGAHRFHRFAHHPLCDRYAGEVVRVGRVRLCRGCTFAITGGLVGGIVGLAVDAATSLDVLVAPLATVAGFALIIATLYARRRFPKLVTRLVPAALFALAMTCGVLSFEPLGIAAALGAATIVGGLRLLYGKRGADRTPCTTCPERTWTPCSGFAPIIRREAAFQRAARALLR